MNVLLVIVLILILIYFIIWLFSNSKTLSNYQKSSVPLIIPVDKLSKPDSKNYGYSFWIYINSWDSGEKPKSIFYRSATSGSTVSYFPSVTLGGGDNTLTVTIDTVSDTDFTCDMTNIPIQTWTHVVLSLNSKVLDMYMNGKLVKTCVSSSVPSLTSTGDITICPATSTSSPYTTWDGKLARFQYYPEPISSQQAWNLYKAGPSGNLFSSFLNEYKIKLSFLKGGDEKANITI